MGNHLKKHPTYQNVPFHLQVICSQLKNSNLRSKNYVLQQKRAFFWSPWSSFKYLVYITWENEAYLTNS